MWEVYYGAECLEKNSLIFYLSSFLGSLVLLRMLHTSLQGTLEFRFLDDLFGKTLLQKHVGSTMWC